MKKKWLARAGMVLLVIVTVGGWYLFTALSAAGFFKEPVYETSGPVVPTLQRPAMLIFSKTNGFVHTEAIPAARTMLLKIAGQQGWTFYVSDNGAIHNPNDLAKFDVVVWNNVSGDILTANQRIALQDYINGGGGFIGLHGTGGDHQYDWRWQPETLIKAQFIGHPMKPQFQTATIRLESDDPIVSHLGNEWVREDEWYSFESSPRAAGVHVLATLDETTYSPEMWGKSIRMGDDHPIMWKHCVGDGRVFYSALGHSAPSHSEPKYITTITHALAWTIGVEGTACDDGIAVARATATLPVDAAQ